MREAARLGFERIVLPVKNAERAGKVIREINAERADEGEKSIKVKGIKTITEIKELF